MIGKWRVRVLTELVRKVWRHLSSGIPASARKENLLSTVIDVGGIKVSALNDGEVHLPPMYYPGLDFGAHPELLQADGTYHIPVGCFLIQAEDRTVLVDAGLGPSSIPFPGDIAAAAGLTDPPESIAAGGLLPGALAAAGVAPAELAPGVSAHHSPGHTPGHYVVSVSSNGEAAYLLGDAVHHPLQLNDKDISFLSETEPERALQAREELLTALQGRNVSIGMTHFPGLDFQRITTANGRQWTTVG